MLRVPNPSKLAKQLQDGHSRIEQLEAQRHLLYDVISKIRASLDLDYIFRTTTQETCLRLGAERVSVYQFSEDWGGKFISDFEYVEHRWTGPDMLGENVIWNDSYLQEHEGGRYQRNECLTVADVHTAGLSQCHIDILHQFHIRAYATAPIFVGSKLWGVLAAYQHSQPRQWHDWDIQFLSQVATQLGVALKQANLMAETQQKSEQQRLLLDLVAEIRSSLDIRTFLKTTTREVRKALAVDRVGIFQFQADSGYDLGEFVSESVAPEFDSVLFAKIEDHCFGDRFAMEYQKGRIQALSDIEQAELEPCHLKLLKEFQVRAQIIAPLIKDQTLWGLLCVHQCAHTREWHPTEITFVKQLAAQISVAIRHAELFAEYRAQAEELARTVEQLQRANAELERLTHIDALTQVANRRCFDEVLAREWKRLERSQETLSLILFDIDHFKAYNDYYGHQAGDQCLIDIAQAAQSVLRRSTDLVTRYGGEEFALILPGTNQEGAIDIAQRLQLAIQQLKIAHSGIDKPESQVTVSFGIASQIPGAQTSIEQIILQADQALYQAKAKGRDTWVCASLKMHGES